MGSKVRPDCQATTRAHSRCPSNQAEGGRGYEYTMEEMCLSSKGPTKIFSPTNVAPLNSTCCTILNTVVGFFFSARFTAVASFGHLHPLHFTAFHLLISSSNKNYSFTKQLRTCTHQNIPLYAQQLSLNGIFGCHYSPETVKNQAHLQGFS